MKGELQYMYSHTYKEFPAECGFIVLATQLPFFVTLKQNNPEVYSKIVAYARKKEQEKHRKTCVVIYGNYNDGECPKQIPSNQDFSDFSDFIVDSNIAPEIHSDGWVTESLSVVGFKK